MKIKRLLLVDEFTSRIEALAFIADCINKNDPLPDFLFLDIRMPELNGFEFLNELLKIPSEKILGVRIFILSSSLGDSDRNIAASYPIVKGVIGKTFSIERLSEIIEEFS